MADFFSCFSCKLDAGSAEKAARIIALYLSLSSDDLSEPPPSESFSAEIDPLDDRKVWFRDDGSGNPVALIAFVKQCAKEFGLTGRWGFTWAMMCSRPRVDSFGGGGIWIDLGTQTEIATISSQAWLKFMQEHNGPFVIPL